MGFFLLFVVQFFAGAVGGSRKGAAAVAATDDLDIAMVDCHGTEEGVKGCRGMPLPHTLRSNV